MSTGLVATLDALALRLSQTARDIQSGAVTLGTDAGRRADLAMAAEDLINTVCEPRERDQRIFNQVAHYTAIRLFVKWKVFEKLPTEPGTAISYAALAAKVGADEALIGEAVHSLPPLAVLQSQLTPGLANARSPSRTRPRVTWHLQPGRERLGRPHRPLPGVPDQPSPVLG